MTDRIKIYGNKKNGYTVERNHRTAGRVVKTQNGWKTSYTISPAYGTGTCPRVFPERIFRLRRDAADFLVEESRRQDRETWKETRERHGYPLYSYDMD